MRQELRDLKAAPAVPEAPAPQSEAATDDKQVDEVVNEVMARLPGWLKNTKVGAAIRLRPEYGHNFFPTGPINLNDTSDTLAGQRTDLWVEVNPDPHLRGFVKIRDVRNWGSEPSTVSTGLETQSTDLFEGYLDVIRPFDVPIKARGGRQSIAQGRQRLVGGLDWALQGRSFDGGRLWIDLSGEDFANAAPGDWLIDGFFTQIAESPVLDDNDAFFSGVMASTKLAKWLDAEAFVYVLDSNAEILGERGAIDGTDGTNLFTWGGRLDYHFGNVRDGVAVRGDFFGATQTGAVGPDHVDGAFAVSLTNEIGMPLGDQAEVWLRSAYNLASGDRNPGDGKTNTFRNLFPTNHGYYGYMDLFSLQNVINPMVGVAVVPCEGWKAALDWHWFRLYSDRDGWYRATGAPVARDPSGGSGRDAGQELDLTVWYAYNQYLSVMAGYSHYFAGGFQREIAQGGGAAPNVTRFEDADWAMLQVQLSYP